MKQLGIIAIFMALASALYAQGSIVVEGKSSVKLIPNQLIFNINMSVKDSNYTTCANLALKQIEKIKSEFKRHGIDESLIKTQNYSIREVRKHNYQTQKSEFEGFQANIPITITTTRDNSKNDKIYEIIKNNFEANFNLNFALTPEQVDAVKEKLIALAIKDAQQKMQVIIQSAAIEAGKISKIQYGEPRSVRPYQRNNDLMLAGKMMAMDAESSISETMNPDEIEMQTNIIVEWAIKE